MGHRKSSVVADFGVYEEPSRFDHRTGNCDFKLPEAFGEPFDDHQVLDLRPNISEEEYIEAIAAIKEYIRAGDTYQVNYTLKLLFELAGSPESLYRDLRRSQSVSYGAYIRWGEQRIMSFSPELFFRKDRGGLTARPMKGTLHRGRDGAEDEVARSFLQQDEKNRSENVMIVDLLRNDLGQVLHEAGGGEVKVASLFDVETYESLLQMTSTILGIRRGGRPGSAAACRPVFSALSLRVGHRCTETAHHGDHRRAGEGKPRRLHRGHRFSGSGRFGDFQCPDPHPGFFRWIGGDGHRLGCDPRFRSP